VSAAGEIVVRGARVHNLKNLDVRVPLGRLVALTGISGSGKSSLALGVLYAEGSRRYVEALSTYTRRRLSQAARADVDEVEHIPSALALRQRPTVPGIRSTFGTATELLNVLRLIYSRLGSHRCPNGHQVPPSLDVAETGHVTCPRCGVRFAAPGAESFAFNSEGACPRCAGTGQTRIVDEDALVPDESLTIRDRAVAAWSSFGLSFMPEVVAELGVRVDVPFRDLSDAERETVLHGDETSRRVVVTSRSGKVFELNATYRSARRAVEEALAKAQSEKGVARLDRFVSVGTCPECGGSRLNERARSTVVDGRDLAAACALTLDESVDAVAAVPASLPEGMRPLAARLVAEFTGLARRLRQLGLGYLTLDRASPTLSTGELQRVQLTRAVRNRTTGVLYVLDEPSIGLHPQNVDGLVGVVDDLVADGNSVVLVDHDVRILREADWIIEIGPGSGRDGGQVVAEGDVATIEASPASRIAGFLSGREPVVVRPRAEAVFAHGRIRLRTAPHHTVRALAVEFPVGRLTAVTGVSGSGKTTLVLESLAPALAGERPPKHVVALEPAGVERVVIVDATPIGKNVRSTVATYSGVLDQLRRAYADQPAAREAGLTAADFSYNTGSARCPRCDGTGQISLDVQFLPDIEIPCPLCGGSRYDPAMPLVRRDGLSLPEALALTVADAVDVFAELPKTRSRLRTLADIGLGYLTLGEATPSLSGGEAQRLKLASELDRPQRGTLFVFDEPSVGLHPVDVRTLLGVLQRLVDAGGTVVVVEHDLDLIANADHVVDLGPGGGTAGGRIVAAGTPDEVAATPESVTGKFLREVLKPV